MQIKFHIWALLYQHCNKIQKIFGMKRYQCLSINRMNDQDPLLYFQVFCQFQRNGGYTFIPRSALTAGSDLLYGQFKIDELQTDKSKALIRFHTLVSSTILFQMVCAYRRYLRSHPCTILPLYYFCSRFTNNDELRWILIGDVW